MKTIKAEINLYEYKELKEKAKQKALKEHSEFYFSNPPQYENKEGVLVDEELNNYSDKDLKELIEESIIINEYWFFENGEISDCITYTEGHKKSGTTEFKFQNKVYII